VPVLEALDRRRAEEALKVLEGKCFYRVSGTVILRLLLRLYSGSIQAPFRLYSGSIQAPLRLH
jgi:hypothetical protein